MNKELITKGVKAGTILLSLLGINIAPEQAAKFAEALFTTVSGIFMVAYLLEMWWKRKK